MPERPFMACFAFTSASTSTATTVMTMATPLKPTLMFVALATFVLVSLVNNNRNTSTILQFDSPTMVSKRNEEEWNTTIYGLIHVAKTGGSNTNGLLAGKYDNVCGNKGNSFNAFAVQKKRREGLGENQSEKQNTRNNNKLRKKWDEIEFPEMTSSIGFANCDYIAVEAHYEAWVRHVFDALDFNARNWTLELHLPCRDPLDHLMSACNHLRNTFRCPQAKDGDNLAIQEEIKKCVFLVNKFHRFDPKLKEERGEQIQIRCFRPFPYLDAYVDYMGNYLRRRKLEVEYIPLPTNKNRNKSEECIWAQSKEYQDTVRALIRKVDVTGYYEFCDSCIGSNDELILSSSSSSSQE